MRTKSSLGDSDVLSTPSATVTAAAGVTRAQMMTLIAAFLGWLFDGLEMGIFPLVARPALQDLQAATGVIDEGFVQTWMGRITASFLFGAAAGGLVFGWLGDRIGRVRAMLVSVLFYSLFTGLNYFVQAPWQLAALRFVAALGMGGEWSLGVALVMETWPDHKRPLMAGLIGTSSCLGYALIAVIALFFQVTTDAWRWVMIVGAVPALLALFIRWFVPESAAWKQAVIREGRSRPLREIFGPALRRRTLLAILLSSVPLFVTWGVVLWIPLWADQLTGGQAPRVKAWCLLAISLGAAVGALVAPLLDARFARRTVYVGLCIGSFLVCGTLFLGFSAFSAGFLLVTGLVGVFTSSFYGWLPQYLPELFPTRVRATGQGICYNFGRIVTAIGAWQMGNIMSWFDHSYARAGAALLFVYFIGIVAIWFMPETKGKPLPQ